jgi:hypothetical protein
MNAMRWCLGGLVLILARPALAEQPCDPYSGEEPQPIPPALRLANTCGNGRIDTYATACTMHVSGGCGHKERRDVGCDQATETCDGRDVRGQTCRDLGFAGGTLGCKAGCGELETSGCTLCAAGARCAELPRQTLNTDQLMVVARGAAVRAFWVVGGRALMTATVDARAQLGVPTAIGRYENPVIATVIGRGDAWLVVIGERTHPALAVVHADGKVTTTPLPGEYASIAWPILPIPGGDTSAVLVGTLNNYPAIVVTDARGTVSPAAAPLYAANLYNRLALVPLRAGRHAVRWGGWQGEVVAQAGDALALMFQPEVGSEPILLVDVWRGGKLSGVAWTPSPALAPGPSVTVAVDGAPVASFGKIRDVIDGKPHPVTPLVMPAPTAHPLLPLAYEPTGLTDAPRLTVAETPDFDVHAFVLDPPTETEVVGGGRAVIGVVPHRRRGR